MRSDVKQTVGRPDNTFFIRNSIICGVILVVMLLVAPAVFAKIMVPMAAQGIKVAWYALFVPITAAMMGVWLFRSWRRRWPLAYMNNYRAQAKAGGFSTCPRCGVSFVLKKRTRFRSQKTGEEVTTTTYSDGSQTVDRKPIYASVAYTDHYYGCANDSCNLEAEASYNESHLPWKMQEIRYLVLGDGRSNKSAAGLLLSRLLMPILAVVVVIASGAVIWGYADYQDGEWIGITTDREPERSAAEYADYLHGLDTAYPNWTVSYEKEATDMLGYLGNHIGKDATKGYFMACYQTDDGVVLEYNFYGNDAGTDLPDGRYTLMNLDGVMVLVDETNEKIYKQDTEFYEAYAPKLQALSYDELLKTVLTRVDGGEHGIYNSALPMEFIRKDNTTAYSYMKSNDTLQINSEFRAVTIHPEEELEERWIFAYSDHEYVPDNWEGYVYSDAAPLYDENDELGKLITKSKGKHSDYTLYRGGEEVLAVDVETLPNGFSMEFDKVQAGNELGFEEDVEYRINTTAKTLTKIVVDENYQRVSVDMPLSEYQAQYDYLLSIVPERCICAIIDMDEATVKNEYLGLVKNYVMKDESGNVTAEMKVMFGVIGEVIHHISEDEYAMIELGY